MSFLKELHCKNWNESISSDLQQHSVDALENGKILFLPDLPFLLLEHEKKFLAPHYADKQAKNISYNANTLSLSGTTCIGQDALDLKNMMQRFSKQATSLIQHVLPHYANAMKIGRTSFRPVEIAGRITSYRKDDTRLHVDAFPSSPNQGKRILRVFTNIHPEGKERLWRIGEPFFDIAKQFLPRVRKAWKGSALLLKTFKITKSYRTEYDHIMLQIHNAMKADMHYQKNSPQQTFGFAPGNTWIVQTDHVSHAAMSGQHVLEQTFYLPVHAMTNPQHSPLRILENFTGKSLT